MRAHEYLDAMLSLPRLAAARVSPDGAWVAWTWFHTAPAAEVYVAPANGSAPPTRLTDTPDDTIMVSWTADSRAVIVAQDHDGDERSQLFRVDLAAPLAMVPLTEPAPHHYLRGGQLHPNGRWLVYAANTDAATGEEIEPYWIYRHDLHSGERRVLAHARKAAYVRPELNEQGTHILYNRSDQHPAGTQVWMVDIEGQDDREVLNVGAAAKVSATWFPDGRRAAVLAEHGAYRRVGVWDRLTGEVRWVLDDSLRNIERAVVPHGSSFIVIEEVRDARSSTSLLDPESRMEAHLPELPGTLQFLAPLGTGGAWAAIYAHSRQPTDVVRCALGDLRPQALTSLTRVWERTPLRQDDLCAAEDVRWHSVDGLPIQGWFYRAREPRGMVVYVHGGPTAHSQDRLNVEIQFLVAQGFHVLDPNYRGSTGFGLAFQESIKEDGWGGREQDDIRTGVEALIAAGIAQPGTVGITGTSYGGYSAWCAITRWPGDLLAAAAPVCGMTDLVVDYQTTRPDLRPYSEEMLGGTPDTAPQRYHDRSPIHFVDRIQGKLLIVQGLQDPNVTPENVRAVEAALKAAGITYEVLTFADEGHGIGRPANLRTLYLRLAEFFGRAFAGVTV
jgi:dipeptidyl aminopeptidase/acylaminoacyl peptidase